MKQKGSIKCSMIHQGLGPIIYGLERSKETSLIHEHYLNPKIENEPICCITCGCCYCEVCGRLVGYSS